MIGFNAESRTKTVALIACLPVGSGLKMPGSTRLKLVSEGEMLVRDVIIKVPDCLSSPMTCTYCWPGTGDHVAVTDSSQPGGSKATDVFTFSFAEEVAGTRKASEKSAAAMGRPRSLLRGTFFLDTVYLVSRSTDWLTSSLKGPQFSAMGAALQAKRHFSRLRGAADA